jgi:hypothetical protein
MYAFRTSHFIEKYPDRRQVVREPFDHLAGQIEGGDAGTQAKVANVYLRSQMRRKVWGAKTLFTARDYPICRRNRVLRRYTDDAEKLRG